MLVSNNTIIECKTQEPRVSESNLQSHSLLKQVNAIKGFTLSCCNSFNPLYHRRISNQQHLERLAANLNLKVSELDNYNDEKNGVTINKSPPHTTLLEDLKEKNLSKTSTLAYCEEIEDIDTVNPKILKNNAETKNDLREDKAQSCLDIIKETTRVSGLIALAAVKHYGPKVAISIGWPILVPLYLGYKAAKLIAGKSPSCSSARSERYTYGQNGRTYQSSGYGTYSSARTERFVYGT